MQTRNYAQETPDMVLYRQNKKTSLGYVKNIHNWTADYNFGAASEMSFEVPKKVYDTRTNSWMDNPNYDNLKPDMLLYLNDSTEYFKFTGSYVKDDSEYNIKSGKIKPIDSLTYTPSASNFEIQDETELFDIGTAAGYNFVWGGYIHYDGSYGESLGSFVDFSDDLGGVYYKYNSYHYLACKSYIPAHSGDILALRSHNSDKTLNYVYFVHYYTDSKVDTYLSSQSWVYSTNTGDFVVRMPIDFGTDSDGNKIDSGYVRISIYVPTATIEDGVYKTNLPVSGWIKLYSRERLCTWFSTNDEQWGVKDNWWIIDNIEETNDNGSNCTLKVSAKSYSMVLSKKCFSLTGNTMPLYIPDRINDLVTGSQWLYTQTKHTPQNFTRGLLNQILDYLPQWKIGHISRTTCLKYRTIDDIDNTNIYSLLNNDIASKYQCYFVFDSENMTINVVNGSVQSNNWKYHLDNAQIGYHSKAILTWQNAIKSTNIHSTDDRCVTALRVHTANDKYGLGLINPTGDNILYNFDSIKNQLDYVVDGSKDGRTLKTAVEEWVSNYNKFKTTYQSKGKKLVDANLKRIQWKSKVQKALTNYLTIADAINTKLIAKYGLNDKEVIYQVIGNTPYGYPVYKLLINDQPRNPNGMKPYKKGDGASYTAVYPGYVNYYNESYYTKLYSNAKTYYETNNRYEGYVSTYNTTYKAMKEIAKQLTLNYKTAIQANKDGIVTILSPAEILELQNYITEGDWTNDNVVFSDTYSANDIITTLQDVMAQAKSDHDSYLSKQCYEFEIESANILAIPEMKGNIADLTLGTALSLEVKDGDWQYPILLSIHINYDDVSDFSLTFNTNYSAKPLKKRFIDCFNTISQTSVRNTTFNFTE